MAKLIKPASTPAPVAPAAPPAPPKLKSQTPVFDIRSGVLHSDNWTGEHVELELRPLGQARRVRLTVWNPYYNRAYLNNEVSVALDDRVVFAERLQPARTATVDHELAAGEPLRVRVTTAACLEPDPLDPRSRGVILKLSQEAV